VHGDFRPELCNGDRNAKWKVECNTYREMELSKDNLLSYVNVYDDVLD